jgi:hypothetical protein
MMLGSAGGTPPVGADVVGGGVVGADVVGGGVVGADVVGGGVVGANVVARGVVGGCTAVLAHAISESTPGMLLAMARNLKQARASEGSPLTMKEVTDFSGWSAPVTSPVCGSTCSSS